MATTNKKSCPICKLGSNEVHYSDYGERLSLDCARCGKFTITATAAAVAEKNNLSPKLSAWIRDRNENGVDVPEINSASLKEIETKLPTYRVADKQLLLLRALEKKTEFPGQAVTVHEHLDFPLAWATSEKEFLYLLRSLIERGFVRRIDGLPELTDSFVFEMQITPVGWTFLDEHARPSVISDQAFVAMAFAPELNSAWEAGIRPALRKAGFMPYRVDVDLHIERIDAKIMSEIKNSRFLVADVTLQRPGVYFEAGYAAGLGLPVFWTVRQDDLKNVHFDTRQYNHIVWKNEDHLAEQLYSFVNAIIGKGSSN